jgi:hypothetical protein
MPQRLDRRQGGEGPTPRTLPRLGPPLMPNCSTFSTQDNMSALSPFLQVDRVVQRGSNPCLHLERLSRADSVTCGERWKAPLTWGFRSRLILVATPRFLCRAG